ncbi:hypothetical protein AVEN_105049-1 [Araneus ventricosus]|uniref:Uncharacterized protein n=1 Tax=Araneus ventricosus TaxID=182803 RepID=A0A4Y2RL24_ARAVE|nr:hypothetical protein AVEN_105049-1 [Araneus ventricosus]
MECTSGFVKVRLLIIIEQTETVIRNELFHLSPTRVCTFRTPQSTVAVEITQEYERSWKLIDQNINTLPTGRRLIDVLFSAHTDRPSIIRRFAPQRLPTGRRLIDVLLPSAYRPVVD